MIVPTTFILVIKRDLQGKELVIPIVPAFFRVKRKQVAYFTLLAKQLFGKSSKWGLITSQTRISWSRMEWFGSLISLRWKHGCYAS